MTETIKIHIELIQEGNVLEYVINCRVDCDTIKAEVTIISFSMQIK